MVRLNAWIVRPFFASYFLLSVLPFFRKVDLSHVPVSFYCRDSECSIPITSGRFILDHEESGIRKDVNVEILAKSSEASSTSAVVRASGRIFVVDSSYLSEASNINPSDLVRVKTKGLSLISAILHYQAQSSHPQRHARDLQPPEEPTPNLSSHVKTRSSNEGVTKSSSGKFDATNIQSSVKQVEDRKPDLIPNTINDKHNPETITQPAEIHFNVDYIPQGQVVENYSSNFSSLTPAELLFNHSGDIQFDQARLDPPSTIARHDTSKVNSEPPATKHKFSSSLNTAINEKPQSEKQLPNTVDTSSESKSKIVDVNVRGKDNNENRTSSSDLPSNTPSASGTTVNIVGGDIHDQGYSESENELWHSDTRKYGAKFNVQANVNEDVAVLKESSSNVDNLLPKEHDPLSNGSEIEAVLENVLNSAYNLTVTESGYISVNQTPAAEPSSGISNELNGSEEMKEESKSATNTANVHRASILNHTLPIHVGLIQCIAMAATATTNYKHDRLTENKIVSPLSQLLMYAVKYFISSADAIISRLPPSFCAHLDYLMMGTLSLPLNFLFAWVVFVIQAITLYVILWLSILLISRPTVLLFWKSNKNVSSNPSKELLISAERVNLLSSQLTDQEAINGHLSCWAAELLIKLQNMEIEMNDRDECLSTTKYEFTTTSEKLVVIEEDHNKLLQNHQDLQKEFTDCKHEFSKERSLWQDEKILLKESFSVQLCKVQNELETAKQEAKQKHEECCRQSMDHYDRMKDMQLEMERANQSRKEVEEKLIAAETNFNSLAATFPTLKGLEVALGQDSKPGIFNSVDTVVNTLTNSVTEANNDSETDSQSELTMQDNEMIDSPTDPTSKVRESLALFLDIGRLRLDLESANGQLKAAEAKINDEQELRSKLEKQLEQSNRECAEQGLEIDRLTDECKSAQVGFDVLSEYFKKREVELQRDLGKQMVVGTELSEALSIMEKRNKELEVELIMLRERMSSYHREASENKSNYRRRVSELEKRYHDKSEAARSAEHAAKEMREENTILQQMLPGANPSTLRRQLVKHIGEKAGDPPSKPHSNEHTTYHKLSPSTSVSSSSWLPGPNGLPLSIPPPIGLRMPMGRMPLPPFLPPGSNIPFLPPGLLPSNFPGPAKDSRSPGSTTGSTVSRYSNGSDRSTMS